MLSLEITSYEENSQQDAHPSRYVLTYAHIHYRYLQSNSDVFIVELFSPPA